VAAVVEVHAGESEMGGLKREQAQPNDAVGVVGMVAVAVAVAVVVVDARCFHSWLTCQRELSRTFVSCRLSQSDANSHFHMRWHKGEHVCVTE
jgi:hypothetical protein